MITVSVYDVPIQCIPYENQCKCYKELLSRSWHVLFFTLNYFFLIHTLSSSARKLKVVVAVILSKLNRRPLFNDIYYKTILV